MGRALMHHSCFTGQSIKIRVKPCLSAIPLVPLSGQANRGSDPRAGRRLLQREDSRRDDTRRRCTGGLFVIHKHAASRLHWDLRLESEARSHRGPFPKGPSLDPAEKRLAVHVEDHPLEYVDFEEVIPPGELWGGSDDRMGPGELGRPRGPRDRA